METSRIKSKVKNHIDIEDYINKHRDIDSEYIIDKAIDMSVDLCCREIDNRNKVFFKKGVNLLCLRYNIAKKMKKKALLFEHKTKNKDGKLAWKEIIKWLSNLMSENKTITESNSIGLGEISFEKDAEDGEKVKEEKHDK